MITYACHGRRHECRVGSKRRTCGWGLRTAGPARSNPGPAHRGRGQPRLARFSIGWASCFHPTYWLGGVFGAPSGGGQQLATLMSSWWLGWTHVTFVGDELLLCCHAHGFDADV